MSVSKPGSLSRLQEEKYNAQLCLGKRLVDQGSAFSKEVTWIASICCRCALMPKSGFGSTVSEVLFLTPLSLYSPLLDGRSWLWL